MKKWSSLCLGVMVLCTGCAAGDEGPKPAEEGSDQEVKSLFVLAGEERCTPELDERCRARAQALLDSDDLVARSVCQESLGAPVCAIGAHCVGDPADWPPAPCICAPGVICAPGQVCAGSGPDDPPLCVPVSD